MPPKRPERTERRAHERALRRVVRDREKVAALAPGGAEDHPIHVSSASVIEVRVGATPCAQCEGEYRLVEHEVAGPGLRRCDVRCRRCGVARSLWFRIEPELDEPN